VRTDNELESEIARIVQMDWESYRSFINRHPLRRYLL
jgi:hypothetical protein